MSEDRGDPLSPDRDLPPARVAWQRLFLMARPRLTKANVLGLVLALALGFALMTQVQQSRSLESLREDELVGLLDNVTQDGQRLAGEITELERTRDELAQGATSEEAAIASAQERLDTLGILAGTRAAEGPGIRMTITNPEGKIGATILLDAIEELRDAGAEAIQVANVRVVAGTYLTDSPDGVSVSGIAIEAPYVFLAIGDPATMASAMDIPGGVVTSVRGQGGETSIAQLDQVEITALHTIKTPQYASPVTPSSPSPTK